ncbi:MAG: TolC family protein [Phycisphaeraceae bacterium]|nr:TolC family protein [Phycisphaeraceae bacterium]MCW5754105.1 TolC family protein [Phycisphaeraceae bacterium]
MKPRPRVERSFKRCLPVVLAAGMVVGSGGGCSSGMEAIDNRTRSLMRERSLALGKDATPPARVLQAEHAARESMYERRPPTLNPDAASLMFARAKADRDVASLLDAYSTASEEYAESATRLDLFGVWRTAQQMGREYLAQEEDYIFAAIRLLIERHRWSPRLFNDTSVNLSGRGDDGAWRSALNVINELRATQRLPFGGEIEARWLVEATRQLRDVATDRYVQSSELAISATIPLLRNAGRYAQEDIIQAERNLVYAARDFEQFRRAYLVEIARDYFALLQSQAQIANQLRQIESQERFLESTAEKVAAGRLRGFQERLVRTQLARSRSSLENLREQYRLQRSRFKIRMGLSPDMPVEFDPFELDLPVPDVSELHASELALLYRLDLQNRRDQLADAHRAVRNARNQLLPDLNLRATGALPTDEDRSEGGLRFDGDDARYSLGVTFGLPLDREIERLNLRQSLIRLGQQERQYEQFRDTLLVEARQSVRSVALAQYQLQLAEAQIRDTELRLEEQRINEDIIDPQQRIDTENDLLEARNARDQSITDLRNAILNYLLVTGQLRVEPDGTIKRLPGMTVLDAEERPPQSSENGEGD